MNKKTNDRVPPDTRSARRRLIRGAFAAPAALTLYSGRAFARASMSCVAKQVANPPTPLPTAFPGPDKWVRVQLWTVGKDKKLSTWVKGADVVALTSRTATTGAAVFSVAATRPYLSSDAWQCFTAGENSDYRVDQRLTSPPTSSNTTLLQNGAHVAVRVDADGNIIGVVGIGTDGSTVANTCWASFNGVPIR